MKNLTLKGMLYTLYTLYLAKAKLNINEETVSIWTHNCIRELDSYYIRYVKTIIVDQI